MSDTHNETARIEAFSDGVFAIAITLLILEVKVPRAGGASLASQLGAQWPAYFAFLASFFQIGVMWINHHTLFGLIRRSDHTLLLLNGLVLFGVTVVPFPTAVLAEHFATPDRHVAAALYNGWFILIALFFTWMWTYASTGRRLLGAADDDRDVETIRRHYRFGWLTYSTVFAIGWVSLPASVACNILLAAWFGLPPRWFRPRA